AELPADRGQRHVCDRRRKARLSAGPERYPRPSPARSLEAAGRAARPLVPVGDLRWHPPPPASPGTPPPSRAPPPPTSRAPPPPTPRAPPPRLRRALPRLRGPPLPRLRRVLPRLRGHPLPRLRRVLPRLRGGEIELPQFGTFSGSGARARMRSGARARP